MSDQQTRDYSYTQERELSWLRFNERVMEEARMSPSPSSSASSSPPSSPATWMSSS